MTTVNLDSSALTSALEQLRLKLLDLTGRNRLINFKHTAGKSLQFIEGLLIHFQIWAISGRVHVEI